RCQPKARAGTPLALSHGFYNTLSGFIQGRFHEKLGPSAALLEQMFSRFMEGRDPTQFTLREKATFVAQGVLSGKIFELAKPANVSLWNELSRYFARPEVQEMTDTVPEKLRNTKRAWFTDTLEDVNGVATTIRKMTAAAKNAGADLTVVTSRSEIHITDIPIKNFKPIGEFELPEYELQKLSFPPILRMLDYVQREGFTEIIISTPGPIGLTALAAAKMLNLQTSGIYHTDFPQY